jgi:hypothetical protein
MSANQWVFLLVPIMFSVINAAMLGVIVWYLGPLWTIAASVIYVLAIIGVLKVCLPVILGKE